MIEQKKNLARSGKGFAMLAVLLVLALVNPAAMSGSGKKKQPAEAPTDRNLLDHLDISKIVWPEPPNITRVRYLDYFAGEKLPDFKALAAQKKQSSWMDRLAGTDPNARKENPLVNHFFMGEPHGMATDSKGNLYVADTKVGAIFIINPETHDTVMIKNRVDANFNTIVGLAIDDGDRLFVSDAGAKRVLVFDKNHKPEAAIREGLVNPVGLAIDNENRFLYVTDSDQDLVLVYDVDNFKLLRKIGTPNTNHESMKPGDFAKPTGIAVDSDGNVYVADMLNARIEIFDADGNFVRTFGKRGDGPGYFAMPKGVAVDCDGHVWVSDAMQNRVQLYSQDGNLLMYMGVVQSILPGMFSGLQYIHIDNKHNRVFTSEVFPGRVQMFQYVTQAEAKAEFDKREATQKAAGDAKSSTSAKPAPAPDEKQPDKSAEAQPKGSATQ